MCRSCYIIYCFIFLNCLFLTNGENDTNTTICAYNLKVNDIASTLITLLGDHNSSKIQELQQKLDKIENYVIDKDKYAEFLLNETMKTDLNETNFFNSLNESDHFQFLLEAKPKNLYLKLKEKMNRDDIINILSESSKKNSLSRSARKMMKSISKKEDIDDDVVNTIVDKLIAQVPKDDHKFEFRKDDNKYWDPQGELEDLKEFHRHDGRRIYKGERTTVTYYPFMVSVHVMGRFWCGGVIYWHDLVITSAACLQLMHNNRFFRENPSVLRIRVGSNHSRIGGDMVEALEVYFHPSYNPRTLRNNIAVVRLRRHLYFNYHRLPKIIDISHNSFGIAPTSEVLVLGWGVTKLSQKLSYEPVFLNRKFLPVYPNVFCKEVYGDKFISSTMFCAGTFTTGEGACDHDAGGPAVLAGRLVGIISFGPAVCGYPNAPTVFTLVGAYADWIETVNESMPAYYRGRKRTTTAGPYQYLTRHTFKKRKLTYLPEFTYSETTTTTTTTTQATTTPTAATTKPSFRQRKKLKKADDSDMDGFSIDFK
ncbi:transmembrane protease serine 9-like [Bicyclus anynana]|uniref:Transmembrane protease serine 9-like n=1 Tax=Bicyclus anynana TaxID=110368 RepID=A0ABM3LRI7_BICAN|nr:transmembrane protease serine 9-like [Bicyclus anynana]